MDEKQTVEHIDGSVKEGISDASLRRRIVWKLDRRILPALFILFLFSFLDRTNIGNAKVLGLASDLGLSADQYSNVLAIYFAFYIASEVPGTLVMRKISPKIWLPLITALWGFVTIGLSFCQNYTHIMVARAFLGLTEGALLPCMVLYLSTLYRREEMALRLGLAYLSNPLSGAFGGLLSSALYKLDGTAGLAGWIFVVEGILTVAASGLTYFMLCDSVENASFLTPEERIFAYERLQVNKQGDKFTFKAVRHGLIGIQTCLTGTAYFCILSALYSFGLFVPTIIKGLGYTATQAQLYSVPPYVVAATMTLIAAIVSDRYKVRGPMILCTLPLSIIGYSILRTSTSNSVRYGALFLASAGLYPAVPPILVWLSNNIQPFYARSAAAGAQLAMANCSGFVAAFIYPASQGPNYIPSHTVILGLLCGAWFFTALNLTYVWYENKQKANGSRDHLIGSGGDDDPNFKYIL